MAKKAKVNRSYLWIIVVVVVIAVFGFYQLPRKQIQTTNTSTTTKSNDTTIYTSKVLKLTIDVPEGYSVDQGFATITLKRTEPINEIDLFRIGTNFDNLDDYLADIAKENKLTIENKENITINNLPAIKVDVNSKINYLIYNANFVYSLETKYPEFSSDLDQIARSFRYAP